MLDTAQEQPPHRPDQDVSADSALSKQTQLVASPATSQFLGKMGPFLAKNSGVDYLIVYNNDDFKGVPGLPASANTPVDRAETAAEKKIRETHNNEQSIDALGAYGRENLRPILPQGLADQVDQMSKQDQKTFYAALSFPAAERNLAREAGESDHAMNESPMHSLHFVLPNGTSVGRIEYDAAKANRIRPDRDTEIADPVPNERAGGYSDNMALAMFHELGHVRKSASGESSPETLSDLNDSMMGINRNGVDVVARRHEETRADRDAFGLYAQARDQGLVTDPLTPQGFLSDRMYSTLRGFDGQSFPLHMTAHQIVANEAVDPKAALDPKADQAFQKFMDKIDLSTGTKMLDDKLNVRPDSELAKVYDKAGPPDHDVSQKCFWRTIGGGENAYKKEWSDGADRMRREFGACVRGGDPQHVVSPALDALNPAASDEMEQKFIRATRDALVQNSPAPLPAP